MSRVLSATAHSHPEVLANLEQFDIQVLITRELGDIRIISDGNKIYEGY